MRLTAFRIQMYKCVIDSGWIEVPSLAALVGKNESGKTSLLKALHKFNPFKPEPYSMDSEWPRGFRKERNASQVVCTARFEFTPEDLESLASMTDREITVKTVEIARAYSGELRILLSEEIFPDRASTVEACKACDVLPALREPVGENFRKKAHECEEEVRRLAGEGRFAELSQLETRHTSTLQDSFSPGTNSPRHHNEQQYVTEYLARLREIVQTLSALPTIREKAMEYVAGRIPTFIYMSDYRAFTGSAQLDLVKRRRDCNDLTDEDRTLLTILELAGLNLDDEVQKAGMPDREQRQYDLDDASATLTRTISDRWKQRRYEVQLRADGPLFFTFVRDEQDPSLIRLEERSRGFQWFFSFDLMFMHESLGSFKNCVILLDEPGLHLHPDGQKDLLRRMEEYARENTLVYTTHLPFMIDPSRPDRIRVLSETDRGTVVTDDLVQAQPEAKFVLQAALGAAAFTACPRPGKNLIVEGLEDLWILGELSSLLNRSGEDGLPDDLIITPAGGPVEAGYMAAFMIGQGLDVAVLLDSGNPGNGERGRLVREWLARYQSKPSKVLYLGETVGAADREFSVEDMFREKFYTQIVRAVHSRHLMAAGCEEIRLDEGEPLQRRAEKALAAYGIAFNKDAVARVIRTTLNRMQSSADLTEETLDMARRLFGAVNAAFARD